MDRRRDGAARRRRTSLDMKSRHRKVSHAPTCAHARWSVDDKLSERSGAWQCVGSCFLTGFPLTCRSASCASESKVSNRRRAGRKSHWRWWRGDPMAEGSERRIK